MIDSNSFGATDCLKFSVLLLGAGVGGLIFLFASILLQEQILTRVNNKRDYALLCARVNFTSLFIGIGCGYQVSETLIQYQQC